VVILLDSLNRHQLETHGPSEFTTPNLKRLAERSLRFTNHHTRSLPCMLDRQRAVGSLEASPVGVCAVAFDLAGHVDVPMRTRLEN
jgi:arylsulfatase A-like enzyme